jgi:hypothetical protein
MQALLNIFIAPDELVADYDTKLKTRYALLVCMLIGGILMYPTFTITQTLMQKQLAASGVTLSQGQIIASLVGGFFVQAIGFLIKWSFQAFFILTIVQFLSLKRRGETAPEMTFRQLLRIVAYSSLVESILQIVKTLVLWIRFQNGDIQTMQDINILLGLNVLFYQSSIGAFLYTFLGEINPFNIWLYGVMGYLIAEIYKLKPKGVYAVLGALWLVLALFISTLATLGEKMSPVNN